MRCSGSIRFWSAEWRTGIHRLPPWNPEQGNPEAGNPEPGNPKPGNPEPDNVKPWNRKEMYIDTAGKTG
ncbi:hypothetical protein F180042I2_40310 [Enterocloster bolteae]